MRFFVLLALCCAAVAGAPSDPERIVGGTVTTINTYPGIASLLHSWNLVTYSHYCGGSILNNRSILSAGHCTQSQAVQYRVRLGSSYSSSGGTVYNVATVINHPQYNTGSFMNNDISILRTSSNIAFGNTVQAAFFAGANYNVADNAVVTAAGWGVTEFGGISNQLRHVQLWIFNQAQCNFIYGGGITANMICSGNQGTGRGQCNADSGGPLYHFNNGNNVVVGLTSFGPAQCGNNNQPVVSARVSQYINWIQANA